MGSKVFRQISRAFGTGTKFRWAQGTSVIARESPLAVCGCREASNCSHVRKSTLYRRSSAKQGPNLLGRRQVVQTRTLRQAQAASTARPAPTHPPKAVRMTQKTGLAKDRR